MGIFVHKESDVNENIITWGLGILISMIFKEHSFRREFFSYPPTSNYQTSGKGKQIIRVLFVNSLPCYDYKICYYVI